MCVRVCFHACPHACGRVACAFVRARTQGITLADCAARRAMRCSRNREKKARREDRVQVYKGSWKGGDLPRSPFIRTAALLCLSSLPDSSSLYFLSLFRLPLLGSFPRARLRFSLSPASFRLVSPFVLSLHRHPSPYFLSSTRREILRA